MKLTYEAILNDPSLLDRIEKQAHRERAEAVHQLIVVPMKRFFADHASASIINSPSRAAANPSSSPQRHGCLT